MATVTRTHVFVDNAVLTAGQLNDEFNNLLNALAIVNADISGSANIAASKISGTAATLSGTETLANKRLTPRVDTVSDAATITPTGDSSDMYTVTALAQAATIAAPSGTPVNGQKLIIRLLDNGTGRALTWNSIYKVIGTTLPTTTVASKYTYVGCIYSTADSKWHVLAVGNES